MFRVEWLREKVLWQKMRIKPPSTTKYNPKPQPINFVASAEEIGIAKHVIHGITFMINLFSEQTLLNCIQILS